MKQLLFVICVSIFAGMFLTQQSLFAKDGEKKSKASASVSVTVDGVEATNIKDELINYCECEQTDSGIKLWAYTKNAKTGVQVNKHVLKTWKIPYQEIMDECNDLASKHKKCE